MTWALLAFLCTAGGQCFPVSDPPARYETALDCRQAKRHYADTNLLDDTWFEARCEPQTER